MPNLIPHGPMHSAFGGDPAPNLLTPDLGIELMDHFLEPTSATPPGNLATWLCGVSTGTIAVDITQVLVPQYNANGVIQFTSGTSPGVSRAVMTLGSQSNLNAPYGWLSLGQGPLIMMWRVRLNDLAPAADCSALRLGFYVDNGAGVGQNGVHALYDPSVSPYWCAANLKATVLTTDSSGSISGTTDNFVWVKMVINAAWTSASVYVAGRLAGTVAVSLAAVHVAAGCTFYFGKKAGSTSSTVYLDAFYLRYLWNAPQPC